MDTEAPSLGIKGLGREADHSQSPTAEGKNAEAIPRLPHMFLLIKHRDNFIFLPSLNKAY
jgi:hypothetical protein